MDHRGGGTATTVAGHRCRRRRHLPGSRRPVPRLPHRTQQRCREADEDPVTPGSANDGHGPHYESDRDGTPENTGHATVRDGTHRGSASRPGRYRPLRPRVEGGPDRRDLPWRTPRYRAVPCRLRPKRRTPGRLPATHSSEPVRPLPRAPPPSRVAWSDSATAVIPLTRGSSIRVCSAVTCLRQ